MAIYKVREEYNGVVTSYHRIYSVNFTNFDEGNLEAIITLESFVSQEERWVRIGTSPFKQEFTVQGGDKSSFLQHCYNAIKAIPEWEGATDC